MHALIISQPYPEQGQRAADRVTDLRWQGLRRSVASVSRSEGRAPALYRHRYDTDVRLIEIETVETNRPDQAVAAERAGKGQIT